MKKKRINCWFPCADFGDCGSGATITHEEDGSLVITAREEEPDGFAPVLASVRLGPKAVNLLTWAIANGWDGVEP
jgi:hypothetical protein